MTVSPPVDPADCLHPADQLFIVRSGEGRWRAVCKHCHTAYDSHTLAKIPDHVLAAVAYQLAGIPVLDAEQIAAARQDGQLLEPGAPWPWLPPAPEGGHDDNCQWYMEAHERTHVVRLAIVTDISPDVERQFQTARVDFGLVAGDHALMLLAHWHAAKRQGLHPWYWDGSYQAGLALRAGLDALPGVADVEPGKHVPVLLALVDRHTGLIAGMRLISWPARAVNAVRAAIAAQLAAGCDLAAGEREINTWIERYPNPVALFERRAEMTWRGGDEVLDQRPN